MYHRAAEKYSILIVQDDFSLAAYWTELFKSERFQRIGKARSVKEAIWCIQECNPVVVILDLCIYWTEEDAEKDWYVLEFGGLEVARRAARAGFDMSRVIVTSANIEPRVKSDLEALGVRWFFQGVCAPGDLVRTVGSLITHSRELPRDRGGIRSNLDDCITACGKTISAL